MTGSRNGWGDVVWGKVALAIATAVLAVASAVGGDKRPWGWILGSAAFLIVHTAVNAARDQSIVRRLGRDYDRVQLRAVQVVADLGQLAADRFDLWMIDLYLPEWRWSIGRKRPFLHRERELRRQLSVSLVDARPQPPIVDLTVGPHGECFTSERPLMWFDDTQHDPSPDNTWPRYDPARNADLATVYGVLSLSPLTDQLGRTCIGVLAVHVEPERDTAVRALGALQSPEGRRRIHNACIDLNGLLSR